MEPVIEDVAVDAAATEKAGKKVRLNQKDRKRLKKEAEEEEEAAAAVAAEPVAKKQKTTKEGEAKEQAARTFNEQGRTAFVRGVGTLSEETVRKYFERYCGRVVNIRMPLDKDGKAKGFALIKFATQFGIRAAAEGEREIEGCKLEVARAGGLADKPEPKKPKKEPKAPVETSPEDIRKVVSVKGMPFSMDEAGIRAHFASCGSIEGVWKPCHGKFKGERHVTFSTVEAAVAALEFNGKDCGGRNITVAVCDRGTRQDPGRKTDVKCDVGKFYDPKKPTEATPTEATPVDDTPVAPAEPGTIVFVKGLPWSMDEAGVRAHFAACGSIANVRQPLNGKVAGEIAFVTFSTVEAATAAVALNGKDCGGRIITVAVSTSTRKEKKVDTAAAAAETESGKAKGKAGKDAKGKGKGKDSTDKGKGKGKDDRVYTVGNSRTVAIKTGSMVEGVGKKTTFAESDDEN